MKEIKGTWEEIVCHIEELKDRRLQLIELDNMEATVKETKPQRNWGMLNALKKIKKQQEGMRKTSNENTLKYIREGRAGGMYGYEPSED